MLHCQFDDLTGLQQTHHSFLMRHVPDQSEISFVSTNQKPVLPDVSVVDRQDSVSHLEFSRGSGRSSSNDLTHIDPLNQSEISMELCQPISWKKE